MLERDIRSKFSLSRHNHSRRRVNMEEITRSFPHTHSARGDIREHAEGLQVLASPVARWGTIQPHA